MRKLITLFAIFAFSIISFSNIYGKSLEVIQADAAKYGEPEEEEIIAYPNLKNTSAVADSFNVKIVMKNLTEGHYVAVCTFQCFTPVTTEWTSPTSFLIAAGQTLNEALSAAMAPATAKFSAHLYPFGVTGTSTIIYRFFNIHDENDYTDAEVTYYVGTSAIDEEPIIKSVSVFPNPATSYVTIGSLSDLSTIKIYNSNGTLVRTVETNGISEAKINLNDFPVGTYYPVIISSGKAVQGSAFVVNK